MSDEHQHGTWPRDEERIVAADPYARRRAMSLIAVGVVVGAAALYWFRVFYIPGLVQRIAASRDGVLELQWLVEIGLAIGGVSSVVEGIRSLRRAVKVARSGRYPPPGMRVLRDTPILTGARAKRKAGWLLVWGIVALVVVPAALAGIAIEFGRVLQRTEAHGNLQDARRDKDAPAPTAANGRLLRAS